MTFLQALLYHKVDLFYYGRYCAHPYPGYDANFAMLMSLTSDELFWARYWTDDSRLLERILQSDNVEKCNRGAKNFVHFRNVSNFRHLLRITASRFYQGEAMPEKPVASYPRFYLWHLKGSRIVHSHSVLLRILHRLTGWQAELPMAEKGMRFYTYVHPPSREVTSFGFAWPDLLKTPAIYLLRLAEFVTEPEGTVKLPGDVTEPEGTEELPGDPEVKTFLLREYVPRDMFEFVMDKSLLNWS